MIKKKQNNPVENKKWQKIRLGDVAEEIREIYSPIPDEHLKYIGLEHIEQNTLKLGSIGDSSKTQSSKKVFKKEDILFGSLRPYFRKVIKPKFDGVCSTDITVIRSRENCCQGFLFYFIANQSFIDYATNISYGTRMPRSPWEILSKSEWVFPELYTQQKIASVLSAYDDLIENNLRRIQILEEMAQLIYREWFMYPFRGVMGTPSPLPSPSGRGCRKAGEGKLKLIDSELGKIPEGWEVRSINEIIDIQSGFAFKSTFFSEDGKYGLVTIKNVQDGIFINKCESRLQDLPFNMPEHCLLKDGDILLSLTGNIGRVCLVYGKDYLLNQRVAKLVPKVKYDVGFTYFLYRQPEFRNRLEQISTGVAQQNLSPIEMGKLKIIYPSIIIRKQYAEISVPILREIILLFQKNVNLRKIRDLLLPKLISGELDVSELDIDSGDINEKK